MTRLSDTLERLADEGTPRGHTEVMRAARDAVAGGDVVAVPSRQRRNRWILATAAAAVIAVVAVSFGVLVSDRDDTRRIDTGHTPRSTTTTTTTPPPSTTITLPPPPVVTVPPPVEGVDTLTTASRLGFAGLGPLQLGMTYDQIEAATGGRLVNRTCSTDLVALPSQSGIADGTLSIFGGGASGVGFIIVSAPGIETISGIQVGSTADQVRATYPSVQGDPSPGSRTYAMAIRNPEGRSVTFEITDGLVTSMTVGISDEAAENWSHC
jgi:hypothetical protein